MAKIGLPKWSGKRSKVSEKSRNFEKDIEWQPCKYSQLLFIMVKKAKGIAFTCILDFNHTLAAAHSHTQPCQSLLCWHTQNMKVDEALAKN